MSKPTYFERLIAKVSPQYALERAVARERLTMFGYDAANPEGVRGSSGGMAKNAGSETPKMAQDRLKMIWEGRDLERNMPVIRCALDRTAQYVCGQIRYQAQTGDDNVDRLYEAYLEDWFENTADLTGRHNFRMLIELGFRSMLRDGDFGFRMVRNGPNLQLQCIEADRIGDPNRVATETDDARVQGIELDPATGSPIAYSIYRRERKSTRYIFDCNVPANQFFLLHKPLRTDEYRGVSWLAPIVAPARDLYEMFAFERGAAKWAASIAGVITVSDPLAKGGAGSAGMFDGKTVTGEPTSKVEGNKLLRLKPNESVTPFDTGRRPSGAFSAYIENGLRDIAMGLNVPYGFFNMAEFGGATVRLEAQQLDRTFQRFQEIITSKALNCITDEVLNDGIAMRKIPETPNWKGRRWQFGPKLTADTGYDTDANIELLRYGLKTASVIAGEQGFDYEDVVDQTIKEVTLVRDRSQAAALPLEMVAPDRFPNATDQLAAVAEATRPPPSPTIADLGDGGVKNLTEVIEAVANGTLPREQAIALLVSVYEFDPEIAAAVVPDVQPLAVAANMPAKPVPPAPAKPAKSAAPGKVNAGGSKK